MFQDFIVKQAIAFCVPQLAVLVKPYLTANAEALLVAEARTLLSGAAVDDVKKYGGWTVDAFAEAWGVK